MLVLCRTNIFNNTHVNFNGILSSLRLKVSCAIENAGGDDGVGSFVVEKTLINKH